MFICYMLMHAIKNARLPRIWARWSRPWSRHISLRSHLRRDDQLMPLSSVTLNGIRGYKVDKLKLRYVHVYVDTNNFLSYYRKAEDTKAH